MTPASEPQPTPTEEKRPDLCPAETTDLRALLLALRPLGEREAFACHAASCPRCFDRVADLFLLTAPDSSDPVHRLLDGLARSLYELAKAHLSGSATPPPFRFDARPGEPAKIVADALDRLDALAEHTDGRSESLPTSRSLRSLLSEIGESHQDRGQTARSLLDWCVTLGGPHGLDAANLLGFLALEDGELDRAERFFRALVERSAGDRYERETQAHAMNNLAGVRARRGDLRGAILWAERSLLLKERLGLDARTNWVNLLAFWLHYGTVYGVERARHATRRLLALDGGREWLRDLLLSAPYADTLAAVRRCGLDREFPELRLPAPPPAQKPGAADAV